jgi:hypothetical protein
MYLNVSRQTSSNTDIQCWRQLAMQLLHGECWALCCKGATEGITGLIQYQIGYWSYLSCRIYSMSNSQTRLRHLKLEKHLAGLVLNIQSVFCNLFRYPAKYKTQILASLPTCTPLRAFANCLTSMWSIWECLVLAEPILIIAPDPRTCSEIVWWLRDLVRPVGSP